MPPIRACQEARGFCRGIGLNIAPLSVVVIGAGVIGLNVALILAQKGYGQCITVIAEHIPGDTSVNYTSPWFVAGANFSAISASDPNALRWDKLGYKYLLDLAARDDSNAFAKETPSVEYWDETPPQPKIESMATYLRNFKEIPREDPPTGVALRIEFTTVTLNAPMHILYIFQKLTQQYGVQIIRKNISHVSSGYLGKDTKVVFNTHNVGIGLYKAEKLSIGRFIIFHVFSNS